MSQQRRIALVGAGLAAFAITALSAAPAATATTVSTATTNRVQAAAGWLATQFVDSSHLPAPHGNHFEQRFGKDYVPNYGANADAIFGLAAAKAGRTKINAALDYLVHHLHGYTDLSNSDGFGPYDGSIGKLALTAIVAHRSPRDLNGHNLIAALHDDECTSVVAEICAAPGSARNIFSSISESFVILAEARAGGAGPSADAVAYFLSLQCANGGFTSGTSACGSGAADVDATSYAIMALTALGGHPGKMHDAAAWLRGKQRAKGYWVSQNVPNTNSTGLAAAALKGAGRHIGHARSWLRAQQVGAGHPGAGAFRYAGDFTPATSAASSPSTLATAQALTGLVDGGSLATLTAAGSASGTELYAPRISAPRRVHVGSTVTFHIFGFAAGESVSCEMDAERAGFGFGTSATPSGTLSGRAHLGHAFIGTNRLKCRGASSHLNASRPITVMPDR